MSDPLVAADSLAVAADQEDRAKILSAVAHDVRSPLQVLGLSLQSLRLRVDGQEERELVQAAEAAYEEIAAIAGDLVDAMQADIGSELVVEDGVNVANLLDSVERRFRRRANELNVELRIVSSRIRCVAPRRYLQRMLDNLVGNALKHADADRVLVGARLKGSGTLVFEVLDDGCGIPADELNLIFEERFRGRAARQNRYRGQGLGLWIVRHFAASLGGSVSVRSKIGRGTRFSLALPTYAARRQPLVARPVSGGQLLQGKLIALLDDDIDSARALRNCLEALGARVFASNDELHFLANVTNLEVEPNLVLLDFNLGSTTAERALNTLRGRFGVALPVAFVTSYAVDVRNTPSCSQSAILEKPLSIADVDRIVALAGGVVG